MSQWPPYGYQISAAPQLPPLQEQEHHHHLHAGYYPSPMSAGVPSLQITTQPDQFPGYGHRSQHVASPLRSHNSSDDGLEAPPLSASTSSQSTARAARQGALTPSPQQSSKPSRHLPTHDPVTGELLVSKRVLQNRKSQREFRQRRAAYLKELEEKVRRYEENGGVTNNAELERVARHLEAENDYLRSVIARLSTQVRGPIPPIPPPSHSRSGSSNNSQPTSPVSSISESRRPSQPYTPQLSYRRDSGQMIHYPPPSFPNYDPSSAQLLAPSPAPLRLQMHNTSMADGDTPIPSLPGPSSAPPSYHPSLQSPHGLYQRSLPQPPSSYSMTHLQHPSLQNFSPQQQQQPQPQDS